jgi:hypothetical protein
MTCRRHCKALKRRFREAVKGPFALRTWTLLQLSSSKTAWATTACGLTGSLALGLAGFGGCAILSHRLEAQAPAALPCFS